MRPLVKSTMKLLLRMKGFWFFLLITPILSTLVLNTKQSNLSYYERSNVSDMTELERIDIKVAYYGGKGKYVIKVYDAARSELSEYLLQNLSESGLFHVCRVDLTDAKILADNALSPEDPDLSVKLQELVNARIEADGFSDRMGAAMYIYPEFDENLIDLNRESLKIYELSEDSRSAALRMELDTQMQKLRSAYQISHSNSEALSYLGRADAATPQKEVVTFSAEGKRNLSMTQVDQRTRMGYAMAILTLGYVFCGLFVAHIAIHEQNDSVYLRVRLAGVNVFTNFLAKVVTVVFVTLMVSAVMGVCNLFLDVESMGIDRVHFLTVLTLMGLIFSTLSMLLGMIVGDVMSSNIAAFTVWSVSSVLSGLYFPMDYTTDTLKVLSGLMPHKWFLDGVEMILLGDKTAVPMLLCVTVAYLVVIGSLGSLGLKVKRVDEWGNA